MNTPEGRQFAASMDLAPGWVEMQIAGCMACNCGCGQPDRVEFTLAGQRVVVVSPHVVDLIIKTLQESRRKLWGEP
jgi:hypothetical protein